MQTYIVIVWAYSKRFHCSFEWQLTSHLTLSIETCIRQTPGAHQMEPPSSLISWVNPFPSRFINRTACFPHPISSNLSCNPCLWYYDELVHFDKEINANVYRHSLWEYYKRFHCSFEWYLTPHMTLYIETCIRRTPCIKRTIQHSPRVSA